MKDIIFLQICYKNGVEIKRYDHLRSVDGPHFKHDMDELKNDALLQLHNDGIAHPPFNDITVVIEKIYL